MRGDYEEREAEGVGTGGGGIAARSAVVEDATPSDLCVRLKHPSPANAGLSSKQIPHPRFARDSE